MLKQNQGTNEIIVKKEIVLASSLSSSLKTELWDAEKQRNYCKSVGKSTKKIMNQGLYSKKSRIRVFVHSSQTSIKTHKTILRRLKKEQSIFMYGCMRRISKLSTRRSSKKKREKRI